VPRKRKKLTRKQLKQQRQAVIARKRQERGWQSRPPLTKPDQDEVVDDIRPLLANINSSNPSDNDLHELLTILVESSRLIDEPEFEELVIEPALAVNTFVDVAKEMEIVPSSPDEVLSEDVAEDTQIEMLEITIRQLLTEEVTQEIVDRLNSLRLRLKRTGNTMETAKVAAVQSFLRDSVDIGALLTVGLVQAVFERSLEAGFALVEVSTELIEAIDPAERDSPLTLRQKLSQSKLAQKAEVMFKKVPGLDKFMTKQVDKIWDEGVEAIRKGDLYLELFTEEELRIAFELFRTIFIEADPKPGQITPEVAAKIITPGKMATFDSEVGNYMGEILTPDRLEQFRVRLRSILDDPDHPKEWSAFILMLQEFIAGDDVSEREKGLFARLFIGEFRAVSTALANEEKEVPDGA
jgi:hypothetical protein